MNSARGGFTLVEVLVGLTVASLALLAGMSALGFVHDRGVHAEEATRAAVAGATQRALLTDWLAGARYRAPTGEEFDGAEQEENGRPVDLLLFPTTARTQLPGAVTVVGLYIDTDPETPERGLVAELISWETIGQSQEGEAPAPDPRRVELVPEAAVMNVRYLTSPADGFPEWVEEWQSRNQLPRAVELTLEAAAGDSLPRLLRYPIRVALGGYR